MLSQLLRSTIRQRHIFRRPVQLCALPQRFYYPEGKLMVRHDGEYYADPMNVSERFIRLVALHDNVKDPSAVTLKSSFDQLHLNSLDISEILLAAEREFDLEISDDDCESFHSVNDVVEFLVRNFHTK